MWCTRGTIGPYTGIPPCQRYLLYMEKTSGEETKIVPFVDDNFYFLLLTTFHRRGNLVLESERRGEDNLTPRFRRSIGLGDSNAVVNFF